MTTHAVNRPRACSKESISKAASRKEDETYVTGTLSAPSNENAAGGFFQQAHNTKSSRDVGARYGYEPN